jgi:hypothetical protein
LEVGTKLKECLALLEIGGLERSMLLDQAGTKSIFDWRVASHYCALSVLLFMNRTEALSMVDEREFAVMDGALAEWEADCGTIANRGLHLHCQR